MKPTTAATATKIAVHVSCVDTALRVIEIPSIPEPSTKTQSNAMIRDKLTQRPTGRCSQRQNAKPNRKRPGLPNINPPASSMP